MSSVRRAGSELLDIYGSAVAVSNPDSGRLRYNVGTQKLQLSTNGSAYLDLGSVAIGGAITGATAGSVLFAGAAGILQQDNTSFFWNDTNNVLQLTTNHATTGPLNITATLATAPSAIAYFNHGSAFQGYMGWFNNLYGGYTYMQNKFGVLALSGQAFVLGSQFVAAHEFGTANVSGIYHEMYQNTVSAAVAPAAAGRIQLNGVKYQISTNTGPYADITLQAAALTTGSVLFANSSGQIAQDNANLFWDDTNNRLGIGTATPAGSLDIRKNQNAATYTTVINTTDGTTAQVTASLSRTDPVTDKFMNWGVTGPSFNDPSYVDMAYIQSQGTPLKIGTLAAHSLRFFTNGVLNTRFTIEIDGSVTIPAYTSGSVPFFATGGALSQDNANFFFDDATNRLGVGINAPLDTLHVRCAVPGNVIRMQNTSTSGYTSIIFIDSAGTFQGGLYWGNSAVTAVHLQNRFALYSETSDFDISNATRREFTFGMTTGSTFQQMQNGSGAAVSDASTGRLRYNTTGHKPQWSSNGGAYFDLAQLTAPLTYSAVAASITFADVNGRLQQDNTNFNWDVTNVNLNVYSSNATGGSLFLRNTNVSNTGPSAIGFLNRTGTFKTYVGFFPSAYAFTHLQGINGYFAFGGEDIALANATENAFRFGMTTATAFMEVASGVSAAVSATNTGRLRYNPFGTKFQVSTNGGSYFDVAINASSLSNGSVLFASASQLAQDNANFFWDDTNNRLGIGTATPTADLEVAGASTNIFINGSTSALLRFPTASIGPPTFTTRSNSTRLVLYPFVGGSTVDFALGIETGTLWSSIGEATSAYNFKWYGGTTELARLTGDRTLQLSASTGAVSDANTGRLRYNTTGQKFQISANAGAYVDLSVYTFERLSVDGAADPALMTTFVSGTGTDLTLANGTVDGFIKNFVITGGSGTIVPANLADGNTLTWTAAPANVSFIWDATNITWHVIGNPYNMVTT